MSAITVGGDLVHYEKLGRGKPVILLHGWIGSWRYWIPLMRHLQLKYSVYAIDLFGFGDSAKNPEKYTIAHQVELVTSFMQQLGIPKAVMIGHGLGTMVVTQFAREQPDKVHRILSVSAPLFDPGDLSSRTPAGTRVLLTPSNSPDPFPKPVEPLAEPPAAPADPQAAAEPTLVRRPPELDIHIGAAPLSDATIPSASNETMSSATRIDRAKLQEAALARGAAAMRGEDKVSSLTPAPAPAPPAAPAPVPTAAPAPASPVTVKPSGSNPLKERLGTSIEALLARCFKRTDPEFEKFQLDLNKMDAAVLDRSASNFDAGAMLDSLRLLETPMVVVHGMDDPVIDPPTESIWSYLTVEKEDSILPIPLPGVRHFPMLEHEPFVRLVNNFLETPDISKLEVQERWRRRSR